MGGLRRFLCRILSVVRSGGDEASLDREITSHLLLLEDEYLRRGLSANDARRAARLALGGVEQTKELHRHARSFAWVGETGRDLRYATRRLTGEVGLTLAVVLTIGLAIGGTGAVFSLINAVLLKPLPYHEPDRLVIVGEGDARRDVAPVNYALLVSHNEAFASIAAITGYSATLNGDRPEKIEGRRITHNFFDVLGVAPALGRGFLSEDDVPGAPRVAILSHTWWRDHFGQDPAVIGRDFLLDNARVTVVGVMPEAFQLLGGDVALWRPAALGPQQLSSGANYLTIVARLKPTVSVGQAQSNLENLSARLSSVLPTTADGFRMHVTGLRDYVAGDARRPLVVLLAAVGVVMLIACANVASLLLARATARRPEIALRSSLGASRGRILRQLWVESLVLGGLGLLAGVLLARGALVFLEQLVPPGMILFARPTLDLRTVGFTAVASLAASVLFGLAPAMHSMTTDLGSALRSRGRGPLGSSARRGALVVAEVAMTLVLLVVAGLLMQSLYRLRYADIGFRPDGVIAVRTTLPPDRYNTHARRAAFYDDVLERVTRLPGVLGAGYTTSVPLAWRGATTGFVIEGRPSDPDVKYDANHRQVSTDYLQVIGVPLVEGRYFTDSDQATSQPVVIINEAMARQYWPEGHAIGERLKANDDQPDVVPWLTVVGIVGDVRQMGLDAPVRPEMYVPYAQFSAQPWFTPRDLVVRASDDPTRLVSAITREIHAVDAALPVSHITLLSDLLDEDVASRRIGTIVLIAFAAFAVLLAVVGIYGVISYFVVQHTSEIGVRIALGAQTGDVLVLVVGKGIVLALIGVGIGAVAAIGATNLVSSLLYDFSGLDPVILMLACLLLVLLASIASYLPARRAATLDPVVALRHG
jgi:putative ABC transport system permease protein